MSVENATRPHSVFLSCCFASSTFVLIESIQAKTSKQRFGRIGSPSAVTAARVLQELRERNRTDELQKTVIIPDIEGSHARCELWVAMHILRIGWLTETARNDEGRDDELLFDRSPSLEWVGGRRGQEKERKLTVSTLLHPQNWIKEQIYESLIWVCCFDGGLTEESRSEVIITEAWLIRWRASGWIFLNNALYWKQWIIPGIISRCFIFGYLAVFFFHL